MLYVLPYGQMSLWGESSCPTCINYSNILFESFFFICIYLNKNTIAKRLLATSRVGPHNMDILSIIFGSLLGNSDVERYTNPSGGGNGTRISFTQEATHKEYLLWLHNLISNLGYCTQKIPKIQTRLGIGGKIRYILRYHTFTYSSINWIYDLWYVNGVKSVPKNIGDFITPLALAIWIIAEGDRVGKGIKFYTNSFSYEDSLLLSKTLFDKYNLHTSVQSAGVKNEYIIYVFKESMPSLRDIVRPYVVSSMLYKLGELHFITIFLLLMYSLKYIRRH